MKSPICAILPGLSLVLLCCAMLLPACQTTATLKNSSSNSSGAAFQALLDSAINDKMPGILVHVESPKHKISWSGAAGVSDTKTQNKLQPDQTFRIASVTKTFVACSILRLWEQGKLALTDPISKYISPEHTAILIEGGYQPDQITIRHLLTHSSGMFDHAAAQIYLEKIQNDPTHHWTRTEQLRGCITWGKLLGKPGEKFSYSDTGYTLLGETLEKITGKTMGDAIENLLKLKALGLKNTWVENEANLHRNDLKRIHQYLDGVDTYHYHASLDLYGGGGLLSTSKDLAIYFQNLFNHKVFDKPATLDTMLAKRNYAVKPRMDYRMGMYFIQLNGVDAYTHSGFWGTQVAFVPSMNATIAANYSQAWTVRGNAPVLAKALAVLQKQ
ncbi:serine hydrolase domain-containing protein [Haliscomenobacter sp.]|uniref:serine hydrolase domain-containing protein n=1 Tax=Haliscomenobacter sp. TaxID=2717303 RepID=UPI003BACD35E